MTQLWRRKTASSAVSVQRTILMMIGAAKEETLSGFAPWCADPALAASVELAENSRLGFARKNPALHPGQWVANSRTPLGLPICCSKTVSDHIDAANNCAPYSPGCSNVPTLQQWQQHNIQQCVNNFYNSTLGKAVQFGSPLALLPGWNPQWGSNLQEWGTAILGKFGGLFGSGAMSGTTQLTTLSGTTTVGSTLELGFGTVLGAVEKAAPPAMLAATITDIGAHMQCDTLPGGALVTPSEGMYGACQRSFSFDPIAIT